MWRDGGALLLNASLNGIADSRTCVCKQNRFFHVWTTCIQLKKKKKSNVIHHHLTLWDVILHTSCLFGEDLMNYSRTSLEFHGNFWPCRVPWRKWQTCFLISQKKKKTHTLAPFWLLVWRQLGIWIFRALAPNRRWCCAVLRYNARLHFCISIFKRKARRSPWIGATLFSAVMCNTSMILTHAWIKREKKVQQRSS